MRAVRQYIIAITDGVNMALNQGGRDKPVIGMKHPLPCFNCREDANVACVRLRIFSVGVML